MQEVLQRVHDNGYTYKGLYEGWYCPRCADFKVENEILEGNRCPIHEIELELHQEENWFFRLSAFQEPLEQLYAEHRDFVMPPARYNEALAVHHLGPAGHLAQPRSGCSGASPCRGTPTTSSTCGSTRCSTTTRRSATRARARTSPTASGPPRYHIIGKDILKFHTVFWPAMLMAARPADPRARLRPRLPARRRRAQDEQVAGQRARPVRGHGSVRRRRAALLPDARRRLRRRRRRSGWTR